MSLEALDFDFSQTTPLADEAAPKRSTTGTAALDMDFSKTTPLTDEAEDYSALSGDFVSDFGKQATATGASALASTPMGLESVARGATRKAISGELGLGLVGLQPVYALGKKLGVTDTLESVADTVVDAIPKIDILQRWSDKGKEVQQDIERSMSAGGQLAKARSTPSGNLLEGEIDFGSDPTLAGYGIQIAGVLGTLAPTIVAGMVGGSGAGAAVGGGMAAGEASTSAQEHFKRLPPEKLAEVSPAYRELIEAGEDPVRAKAIITERAAEAAAIGQGMVAAVGGAATSAIIGGALNKVIGAVPTVAGRMGVGAAAGALEEGAQELGEGLAYDMGVQTQDTSKEIGEDSAANLVLGALGGAGPGGVRGAFTPENAPPPPPIDQRVNPEAGPGPLGMGAQPPGAPPAPTTQPPAPRQPTPGRTLSDAAQTAAEAGGRAPSKFEQLSETQKELLASEAQELGIRQMELQALMGANEGVVIPQHVAELEQTGARLAEIEQMLTDPKAVDAAAKAAEKAAQQEGANVSAGTGDGPRGRAEVGGPSPMGQPPGLGFPAGMVGAAGLPAGDPRQSGAPGGALGVGGGEGGADAALNQPSPRNEPPQGAVGALDVVELPTEGLQLSGDVPQFKQGANQEGVVEPLGGTFDRRGVAPIQVWERADGRQEVISGRHRLDLARRSGDATIPAQIHREADGFTADQAKVLDAELNIRDGQGKAIDYVDYFKTQGISREQAAEEGLVARNPGRRAFEIAASGSEETIAALRGRRISEADAERLVTTAPGDSAIQALGLEQLQAGKSGTAAEAVMQAAQAIRAERGAEAGGEQGDMFGFDDSAIKEAEQMGRVAARKKREASEHLNAIKGANKKPEIAAQYGIDIKDKQALKTKVDELSVRAKAWDNWPTNPELVAEVRNELTGAPKQPDAKPQQPAQQPPPPTQAPAATAPAGDAGAAAGAVGAQEADQGEESAAANKQQTEKPIRFTDNTAVLGGGKAIVGSGNPVTTDPMFRGAIKQFAKTGVVPQEIEDLLELERIERDDEVRVVVNWKRDTPGRGQSPGGTPINGPAGKVLDTDLVRKQDNKPFGTDAAAKTAAKARRVEKTHTPVAVDGGWVLRRNEGAQAAVAPNETADGETQGALLPTGETQPQRIEITGGRSKGERGKVVGTEGDQHIVEIDGRDGQYLVNKNDARPIQGQQQADTGLIGEKSPEAVASLSALAQRQDVPRLEGTTTNGVAANGVAMPEWQDVPGHPGFQARQYVWDGRPTQEIRAPSGAEAKRYIASDGKAYADLSATTNDYRELLDGTVAAEFNAFFDRQLAIEGAAQGQLNFTQVIEQNAPKDWYGDWPKTAQIVNALVDAGLDKARVPTRGQKTEREYTEQVGDFIRSLERSPAQDPNTLPGIEPQNETKQAIADRQREQAKTPENAPSPEGFTLTGSTRPADEAAAAGQQDLLGGAEPQSAPTQQAKPEGYGKNNKVFTEDAAAKAREVLRKKLGQLNSGLDPEIVQAGITLAGYHIEAGARSFADYSKAMISDLGDAVQPYLRSWYEGVRYYPGAQTEGMTPAAEIDAAPQQGAQAEPQAEPQAEQAPLNAGRDALVQDLIQGRSFKSITEARKRIAEVTGTPIQPGTQEAKQADEMIEQAGILAARQIVNDPAGPVDEQITFDALVALADQMPSLNVRTSTSVAQQAYSTPLPLAYVASRRAGVADAGMVLEPTAGNAALLLEATPETANVNELNPWRAAFVRELGFRVTEQDAAASLAAPDRSIDALVTNPPFGVVQDADGNSTTFDMNWAQPGYKTNEIDHAIALRALSKLKDDGKAVLIIGGPNKTLGDDARSDAYNGKAKRGFFFTLYNQYNVTDHFTVSGDLYSKQGAAWPVDVIVIEGRGKSQRALPAVDLPRKINTLEDLRNELPTLSQREGAAAGDGQTRKADPAGTKPASNNAGTGGTTARGRTGGGRADGRPDGVRAGREGEPAGTRSERVPAATTATTEPGDTGGARQRNAAEQPRVENPYQATYTPSSAGRSVGTLVPTNMQTAVKKSLAQIADKHGSVDQYVAKLLDYPVDEVPQRFSAEQVDALALALDNIESGKGFIIGDQTGVGKGRVNAGVIRYAMLRDLTPVFVTVKPNLYSDMLRDLADIGMPDVRPLVTNTGFAIPLDDDARQWYEDAEKAKARGDKPPKKHGKFLSTSGAPVHNKLLRELAETGALKDHDVIFTTYDQMQTVKGERTVRQDFLDRMAAGGVLILDESHNAGGTEAKPRGGKQQDDTGEAKTGRAGFVRAIARGAKGVFYSSATYAKRPDVMDLYFKTDMGLAAGSPKQLADAMEAGGVPLQQVVATMLAESGQYIRREKSFDGIEYRTTTAAVDQQFAENASTVMRDIMRFDVLKKAALKALDKELKAEGKAMSADGSTGGAGAQSTNFTSVMHNLLGQMLLTLKVQPAIDEALGALQRGEKPIIALSNTMGSAIQEYATDVGLKPGDAIALSFADLMKRYLQKSRRVIEGDAFGKKTSRELTDGELGPAAVRHFNKTLEAIDAMGFEQVPISPIDAIHNALRQAGYKTGEITGRGDIIDYSSGRPIYRRRPAAETSAAGKLKAVNDYNSGAVDALIINQSGATGLSAHASEKFADQRRRFMIIAQPELNIDTHMQMLGRINRTGQITGNTGKAPAGKPGAFGLPAYAQLVADIPAEKRPASILSKKMAMLNANTTAARDSALKAKDTPDFMNEYGDQVAAAVMTENPQWHLALGEPLSLAQSGDGLEAQDAMRKVTGRIPVLPLADQEAVYAAIEDAYNDLVDTLSRMGENKLEAKSLDLDAKLIKSVEVVPRKAGTDSPFADGVRAQVMDVKRIGKPMKLDEVRGLIEKNLDGNTPSDWKQRTLSELADRYTPYARDVEESYDLEDQKDAKRRTAELTRLEQQRDRVLSLVRNWSPGTPVTLTTPKGSEYVGYIGKIEHTKSAKNPVAPGAWKATIYIADAAKQLKVPLSRMSWGDVDPAGRYQIATTHGELVRAAFEEGQSASRQDRTIIMGNLLSGYGTFGRGQIINFTDSEGAIQQGILMPQNFDLDKSLEKVPTLFESAEQVVQFVGFEQPATLGTEDGNLTLTRHGGLQLVTPRSKAKGGRFFLNRGLLDALGRDFVTAGNSMQAKFDVERLPAVVKAIYDMGAGPLVAKSHKAEAKAFLEQAAKQGSSDIRSSRTKLPATITVDGKQRPTTNSDGQPIHTTEAGVRNFWRWFGDSKVVDEQGRPIEVYHGTSGRTHDGDIISDDGITNFGNEDRLTFFTDSPKYAEEYTGQGIDLGFVYHEGKDAIYSSYLRLRNPLDISQYSPQQWRAKITPLLEKHMAADGSARYGKVLSEALGIKITEEQAQSFTFSEIEDTHFIANSHGVREALEAGGYDGIIHNERGDSGMEAKAFAVFDAGQVKASRGNTGTFDGANPDIRSSRDLGGLNAPGIGTAEAKAAIDKALSMLPNAPPTYVVRNPGDPKVPQAVWDKEQDARRSGAGASKGVYVDGTVYLFADNLASVDEAIETALHEIIGHDGLRKVFGDALNSVLDQIIDARRKEVLAKAKDYGLGKPANKADKSPDAKRIYTREDLREAADELLAEMAEKNPQLGFVKRAVAAIRKLLSDMGVTMKLSDNDIIYRFILPSRAYQEGKLGEAARGRLQRAAQSNNDIRSSRRTAPPRPRPQQITLGGDLSQPPSNPNPAQAAKARAIRNTAGAKWDTFIYTVQDKFIDLKRIQQGIKALDGTITDLNNAYQGEELFHKRLAKRTKNFQERELKPLLTAINDSGLSVEMLERYLHARHAPEANKILAERNPNEAELEDIRDDLRETVDALKLDLQRAKTQQKATGSIETALKLAREELASWMKAKPYKGTEAERLALSGMSDAEAEAFMDGLSDSERAALEALTEQVDAMQEKTLDTLVQYDLMPKATIETWRDTYQHYVPLHRDEAHEGGTGHPIGQGYQAKGDAAKVRVGSREKVTNILAHIAMQREAALTRGEKNRVAKQLYTLIAQNPDPDVWEIGQWKMKPTLDRKTKTVVQVPDGNYKNQPNVLTLRIGGKDRIITFNEKNERAMRLATTLKNLDIGDMHWVMGAFGKYSRFISAINTQYNPIFGVINFLRDTQAATLQLSTTALKGKEAQVLAAATGIGNKRGALNAIWRAERGKAPKDADQAQLMALWEDMQMTGGSTGYRDMFADPRGRSLKLQKEIQRINSKNVPAKVIRATGEILSNYNEAMENAVRLAAYKVATENGISREQAASIAKNLTVNFNRKGAIGREANALYAFFNAAVQGTTRMVETLTGPAGKAIIGGGIMAGIVQTLIGMMMIRPDDDDDDTMNGWYSIPEFIRERNFIIPLGGSDYITIPMPLGYNVIPNVGRKLVEGVMGAPATTPGKQAADTMLMLASAFNPLGGGSNLAQTLSPTPFDIPVALATNRDWTDRPIAQPNFSGLDLRSGPARGRDGASPIGKAVSSGVNAMTGGTPYAPGWLGEYEPTPDQVDYVFGQLTGGVGRELSKAMTTVSAPFTGDELPAYKIPLVGRLYGNVSGQSGASDIFYKNVQQLNKVKRNIKGAREDRDREAYERYTSDPLARLAGNDIQGKHHRRVKELRERRDMLKREKPDGWRERVDLLNDRIADVMQDLNRRVEAARAQE